ncbi:MAG: polyprenyl synthetase family protein [Halolamina sp.]
MDFLGHRKGLVEDRLERVVDEVGPDELGGQFQHVTLSGGKRVRPVVTLLACEAAGGDIERDPAVDFGVGIELVHTASLVVDDIIDQSAIRRGVDSAWAAFGYGPAIVASDGLLGEAFALFSKNPEAMQVVTEAMVDLGQGEATELVARPTNEDEYMELARRKTGALFRAAAELGAIAADADPVTVETFGDYAERVGVAFQIRDDVLDATADPDELGKPTGQDAAMDRPSIVQVTGLSPDEANALARAQADEALSALDAIETRRSRGDGASTDNGAQAFEYLRDLAEFVVVRER